jgi:hypothetical protein
LSGLPDFSCYNTPEWEKYTRLPQNISNVNKIYPMAVKLHAPGFNEIMLLENWTLAESGLRDFSWYNIPKRGKIYHITIKCTYQIPTKYTKRP